VGDRVVLYHIAGCGRCTECRTGYLVACRSDAVQAYGWTRDGGHADYLLAEESTALRLPDGLSYVDGACVACGFGTAYEALCRAAVSGRDAVLVTGVGPVGMAVSMLAKAMGAPLVVGVDAVQSRLDLAVANGCLDYGVVVGPDAVTQTRAVTGDEGFDVVVDCSGSTEARLLGLQAARRWGRVVFVGEGRSLSIPDLSATVIHQQLTMYGSWVTSLPRMEELLHQLVRWGIHPEVIVTDRFSLADASAAYAGADAGHAGKVALVMDGDVPPALDAAEAARPVRQRRGSRARIAVGPGAAAP